jgi:hypothetical protein
MSPPGLTTIFPALVSRRSASFISVMKRVEPQGVQDRFVTNDVDTPATALYAAAGNLPKEHPDPAPWRPPVGITPRLSDAELVTLATMQAILGYTSEAECRRHARARLRHLFP